MTHIYPVLAGLLVLAGLVGVVVPALPGLPLVLAGVAVWAVPRHDRVGWWTLGVAAAVLAAGMVAKYLLPGRSLRAAGVPGRSLVAGAGLGFVGFFVIPVVGVFVGFVAGVYLAERVRLGDHARAWPSTRRALRAAGWSVLIELAAGLLATAVWLAALLAA